MQAPTDRTIFQNAWVVDDLDAAMQKWIDELKVGPFFVGEHGPNLTDVFYRGEPGELSMKLALAQAGPMQIELIQPTCEGPCAYRDTVSVGTTGFHHMCVWTHDIDADIEYYTSLGYPAANLATAGDMRFGYFDTTPLMNCMLEVVEYGPQIDATFKRIAELGNGWDGNNAVRSMADLF